MASTLAARGAPRSSWFWRLYVIAWVGLGSVALGYLVTLTARPDMMAALTHTSGGAGHSDSHIAAQLDRLRTDVAGVRSDVIEVKSALSQQSERVDELQGGLAALRRHAALATPATERTAAVEPVPSNTAAAPAVVAAVPTALPREDARTDAPSNTETAPLRQSTASAEAVSRRGGPPLPVRSPRASQMRLDSVAEGLGRREPMADAPLRTGSVTPAAARVAAPPARPAKALGKLAPENARDIAPPINSPATPPAAAIQFGPPVVSTAAPPPASAGDATPSGGPVAAVRISTAPSLTSLRVSWQVLSQLHSEQLGGLQPRYRVSRGTEGESFDLVAGPVTDRQQADRLCSELRARGVFCAIDRFGGNAL